MNWHAVTHLGPADNFQPKINHSAPRISIGLDRPGDPWATRNNVLATILEKAGRSPADPILDLLVISLSVYSADLRIPRAFSADRWTRNICLYLPVHEPEAWGSRTPTLTRMLEFLTGDRWTFEFRPTAIESSPAGPPQHKGIQKVCLFSGGLDSLAGAINLLDEGAPVALVGHYGSGVTSPVQQRVLQALVEQFPGLTSDFTIYVQPTKAGQEGESTMRSRSFLFLSLGAAVAAALGTNQTLYVAENGLISLNAPLTKARLGSLSTRTTHPFFIGMFAELLQSLSSEVTIELPYKFLTKGEMLSSVRAKGILASATEHSMSCSHPEVGRYFGNTPGRHCGYCVPCIIRRAALSAAGLHQGHYEVDVLENAAKLTENTRRDLHAFQTAIERLRGAKKSRLLFDVMSTGPLPVTDAANYAAVYRRGMNEVSTFLGLGNIP